MSGKVIVLGGTGRFGRAAINAFLAKGWQVRTLVRSKVRISNSKIEVIEGDAFDHRVVEQACAGMDIIVHALNPQYENWVKEMPILTKNVIHGAKTSGATAMLPGNVYNYGQGMPATLVETTAHNPTSRKGQLRVEMETAFKDISKEGVQTIILRAGDFIEKKKTGNWFDTYMANKVEQGIFTYPGALNIKHAWAYLPDMARAMAALADQRNSLQGFEEFGFEGFGVTGAEMIKSIEAATGKQLKTKTVPWTLFKFMSLFSPKIREVFEMRYLWQVPHSIDGNKFKRLLPNFKMTPLVEAMTEVI